ncbi:hypothetical protein CEXT_652441 [Caerostris extrusa]|uniref:Uncharacterized protein n=1 Tax=Caerostris extrusa TaxID=172846 RepID=A0AAV4Y615_CAEEX|nr:hypothetical protein CEXT_652441 [Caerostris extrusa]
MIPSRKPMEKETNKKRDPYRTHPGVERKGDDLVKQEEGSISDAVWRLEEGDDLVTRECSEAEVGTTFRSKNVPGIKLHLRHQWQKKEKRSLIEFMRKRKSHLHVHFPEVVPLCVIEQEEGSISDALWRLEEGG